MCLGTLRKPLSVYTGCPKLDHWMPGNFHVSWPHTDVGQLWLRWFSGHSVIERSLVHLQSTGLHLSLLLPYHCGWLRLAYLKPYY